MRACHSRGVVPDNCYFQVCHRSLPCREPLPAIQWRVPWRVWARAVWGGGGGPGPQTLPGPGWTRSLWLWWRLAPLPWPLLSGVHPGLLSWPGPNTHLQQTEKRTNNLARRGENKKYQEILKNIYILGVGALPWRYKVKLLLWTEPLWSQSQPFTPHVS